MELDEPRTFLRATQEAYDKDSPTEPYVSFTLGPKPLGRLIVHIWSRDQGWCDQHLLSDDPYANSETWFALGAVPLEVNGEPRLLEVQRNVRASRTVRCHTLEWRLDAQAEAGDEVRQWLESLPVTEEVEIGLYPRAQYPGWKNFVTKVVVEVYDTAHARRGETTHVTKGAPAQQNEQDLDTSSQPPLDTSALDDDILKARTHVVVSLVALSEKLDEKHTVTRDMGVLQEAVQALRQAIDAAGSRFPMLIGSLHCTLSRRLHSQYSKTGALSDLGEAIRSAQKAMEVTPQGVEAWCEFSSHLGVLFYERYVHTGAADDLKPAIRIARLSVNATVGNVKVQNVFLSNLGKYFGEKYSKTKVLGDIDAAVQASRQAVHASSAEDGKRASYLNNLIAHLRIRYEDAGEEKDLEEAIMVAQQAVDALPMEDPSRADILVQLAFFLHQRYEKKETETDLDEAISSLPQSACNASDNGPDEAQSSTSGEVSDLEEIIKIWRQMLSATPDSHPDKPSKLFAFASLLFKRFSRTGSHEHLEESVQIARQAVATSPDDSPQLETFLVHLGTSLYWLAMVTGTASSLEEGVQVARKALEVTLKKDSDPYSSFSILSVLLVLRYARKGSMLDLEESIQIGRQVLDATPRNDSRRAMYLNQLALSLRYRYLCLKTTSDFDEAIEFLRQAAHGVQNDHTTEGATLIHLALRLCERYSERGSQEDLQESIRVARQALELSFDSHFELTERKMALGDVLAHRYWCTKDVADQEESAECYSFCFYFKTNSLTRRIVAASRYLAIIDTHRHLQQASDLAERAVQLIPQLGSYSLQNLDKQDLLTVASGVASNAAAIALQLNRGAATALGLLELGRGVLSGGLLDLRTDISALQRKHPQLAARFLELREQLDGQVTQFASPIGEAAIDRRREDDRRREANNEMEHLLPRIRADPEFERFLLGSSEDEMKLAAKNGPIVVVNTSPLRCDALIVLPSEIRQVALPGLSPDIISRQDPRDSRTLEWLWDTIVNPVLENLVFVEAPSCDSRPRIWWVPTGPLTRFPLHAAGYHGQRGGATALDRVVSSYAPSVKAIVHNHRRTRAASGHGGNMTLISMPVTPSQSNLKFASKELDAVLDMSGTMNLPAVKPPARKNDVLQALESCDIFHFAGHGATDTRSPLHSMLLLDDWEKDPLTVESLLQTNIRARMPPLAYLSACGTSEITNDSLYDEGIHLAGAFQLAGFQNVVGTLWSVEDEACVDMARMTYESLRGKQIDSNSVSEGLNQAAREFRDRHYAGMTRDASIKGEILGDPGMSWVPYVHFG